MLLLKQMHDLAVARNEQWTREPNLHWEGVAERKKTVEKMNQIKNQGLSHLAHSHHLYLQKALRHLHAASYVFVLPQVQILIGSALTEQVVVEKVTTLGSAHGGAKSGP